MPTPPVITPVSPSTFQIAQAGWGRYQADQAVTWSLSTAAQSAGLTLANFADGSVNVDALPSASTGVLTGALIAALISSPSTTSAANLTIVAAGTATPWAPGEVTITATLPQPPTTYLAVDGDEPLLVMATLTLQDGTIRPLADLIWQISVTGTQEPRNWLSASLLPGNLLALAITGGAPAALATGTYYVAVRASNSAGVILRTLQAGFVTIQ